MEQAYPTIPGYDVLTLLGAGASARVWRARRLADDRLMAVKVLPVADGGVAAVLREAAVLSRVRHEHLVHLYDVLPLPGPDGPPVAVALAMQLAEGGSLAGVLAGRGYLSPGELVTVLAPLAGALADLHRSGVVHGDVSPGNVLFTGDGMPMLADLGVCRIAGEQPSAVHGTDGMVAPELLEGFPPGVESDVYALGAVAWTCLVGEPPGWVGTRGSLADLAPEAPAPLRELVLACLAPEPADRPEADEVATQVFDAAPPEPVELGPGADPAAGLTQRIRRAATLEEHADLGPPEGEEAAPVSRRDWRRTHRRSRSAARARGPGARRVVLGVAVAVVMVPLSVLGVRWAAAWVLEAPEGVVTTEGALTTEGSVPDDAPVPTGTSAPPSATSRAPTTATPADRAPELQALLDARAAAWREADTGLLAGALVEDSAAWEADRADLAEADRRGLSYRDLAFTARDVRVVRSGTDAVVLSARVERSAYEVHGGEDGPERHRGSHQDVTFELHRTGAGWRIWSWTAP